MRHTSRLLARYLEAGTPTGLTGLWTHRSPRSALVFLYEETLRSVQRLPESSIYRQSVESLTNHRKRIVEGIKPPGDATWSRNIGGVTEARVSLLGPRAFILEGGRDEAASARNVVALEGLPTSTDLADAEIVVASKSDGAWTFHSLSDEEGPDVLGDSFTAVGRTRSSEADAGWEWAARTGLEDTELESLKKSVSAIASDELKQKVLFVPGSAGDKTDDVENLTKIPVEAEWTAEQVAEAEDKIGAGLIEEVIQVAEGELKLIDVMAKSQAWETLEEKPVPGQWTYFERHSE